MVDPVSRVTNGQVTTAIKLLPLIKTKFEKKIIPEKKLNLRLKTRAGSQSPESIIDFPSPPKLNGAGTPQTRLPGRRAGESQIKLQGRGAVERGGDPQGAEAAAPPPPRPPGRGLPPLPSCCHREPTAMLPHIKDKSSHEEDPDAFSFNSSPMVEKPECPARRRRPIGWLRASHVTGCPCLSHGL